MRNKTVAILGAGIQGICAALALEKRGFDIHLIDQMQSPMMRASLRNEGKIHLGLIYGHDSSLRSAELMLNAALTFAPLLDEWTNYRIQWADIRSQPFTYLVMKDSMLTSDQLRAHYEKVDRLYQSSKSEANYLGTYPERIWRDTAIPEYISPNNVHSAIETAELAINLNPFRHQLVQVTLARPNITWYPGKKVESISRNSSGFNTEGYCSLDGNRWHIKSDVVINCLWENLLSFDREMGIKHDRPWTYRLKYRVIGQLPRQLTHMKALTMTLGQYGDVVPMNGQSYLSWYPHCRKGWSNQIKTPSEWEPACNGTVDSEFANTLAKEVLTALENVVPGIQNTILVNVDAGIILNWGKSDIDDPASEFHERFDLGLTQKDGYYSVNTGKFTCAPLFAQQLAERI